MAGTRYKPGMDVENEGLAQRLRRLREESGLNQSELAVRLQKTASYVSKKESGALRVNHADLKAWAEQCGFHVSVLFTPMSAFGPSSSTHVIARAQYDVAVGAMVEKDTAGELRALLVALAKLPATVRSAVVEDATERALAYQAALADPQFMYDLVQKRFGREGEVSIMDVLREEDS